MRAEQGDLPESQQDIPEVDVERKTRAWLAEFVVRLNLCPFARPVVTSDTLRVVVCLAEGEKGVAKALLDEIDFIQSVSEAEVATTLLICPKALGQFDDYLAFLDGAELLLEEVNLNGVLQLASFHPDYQFAGESIDAASHYTNRAPFPMIHLLREDMVTRALETFPNPEQIPARNIQILKDLGVEHIQEMLAALD